MCEATIFCFVSRYDILRILQNQDIHRHEQAEYKETVFSLMNTSLSPI